MEEKIIKLSEYAFNEADVIDMLIDSVKNFYGIVTYRRKSNPYEEVVLLNDYKGRNVIQEIVDIANKLENRDIYISVDDRCIINVLDVDISSIVDEGPFVRISTATRCVECGEKTITDIVSHLNTLLGYDKYVQLGSQILDIGKIDVSSIVCYPLSYSIAYKETGSVFDTRVTIPKSWNIHNCVQGIVDTANKLEGTERYIYIDGRVFDLSDIVLSSLTEQLDRDNRISFQRKSNGEQIVIDFSNEEMDITQFAKMIISWVI